MSRGGGRGREPVGCGEGEIEERYDGLPSLPWPPTVQDSCPKVFSLLSTPPQMLTRTMAALGGRGRRRRPETAPNGGVNLQGEDRMLASDKH